MSEYEQLHTSGDLDGLIDTMSPEQALLLKQAVVRLSIYYVEQLLPPEELDEGERGCLMAARIWLDSPTPENAEKATMMSIADVYDGGVRYHYYSAIFTDPALTAGADNVKQAIHFASFTIPKGLEQSARQWQLDAALAILQDHKPPPMPPSRTTQEEK